jgi:hypothetical protein
LIGFPSFLGVRSSPKNEVLEMLEEAGLKKYPYLKR